MTRFFILIFISGFILFGIYWYFFGPVNSSKEIKVFVVSKNQVDFDLVKNLYDNKYIKNKHAFELLISFYAPNKKIKSGGFRLSSNMNAWKLMNKIYSNPDLLWVIVGGCLRKEQIGEILANTLGWNEEKLDYWNTIDTNSKPEYQEGVYYPDTYLLPIDETGAQIAKRFINRFNEKLAPLADKYLADNIRWVTGLKIASLIAREAAGEEDMRLISGIIWNRLNIGMPLQIDATMQYTLGKNEKDQWWGTIDLDEKQNESPYNSYLHKELPPTPICSPNISYIEAVLYPEETSCLFYLHDSNKQIHCAETYEEHLKNIETYLN